MSRYSLSNESEKDIIGRYKFGFSKYGELAVEKYLESLQHKLQYLADNPLVCNAHKHFTPPIRIHHHRKHLVIYTNEADSIFIIRKLGDRMDISRNLSN